jgi:hypothetical protein
MYVLPYSFIFWSYTEKYKLMYIMLRKTGQEMMALTCSWMSATLFHENSNSLSGIRACFRYRKKPSSSGRNIRSACPLPPSPRAVRPTLWMYSLGSSGGSYCTIQSTAGMSRPRAATSVHSSLPVSALQNWKNVVVRFVCFCFPCTHQNR